MAQRVITLDEKIEKAQADVAAAQAKYDKAVDVLEKLLTKRKERDNKELLEAFSISEKSLAEVMAFLQGNEQQDD
ncbi:MAG: hypothetical protein ACTTK0_08665 [Stomatobaculum sp.]